MPIPLLDESSLVISFSFFSILPEVGFSIPINIFNSVVYLIRTHNASYFMQMYQKSL